MKRLKKLNLDIYLPIFGFLLMLMTNPDHGGLLTHGFITAFGFGEAIGYMVILSVGMPYIVFAIAKLFKKNLIEGTRNWVIILSFINIFTYSVNILYPAYF